MFLRFLIYCYCISAFLFLFLCFPVIFLFYVPFSQLPCSYCDFSALIFSAHPIWSWRLFWHSHRDASGDSVCWCRGHRQSSIQDRGSQIPVYNTGPQIPGKAGAQYSVYINYFTVTYLLFIPLHFLFSVNWLFHFSELF